MFKNHAVKIQMVKTKNQKNDETTDPVSTQIGQATADLTREIGKNVLKLATGVAGTIVLMKLLDIAGDVIVKKTKSADKED